MKDIQIRQAKAKDKDYFLNDGAGLRIRISPNSNKVWEFRYTFNGNRRKTSFKSYPITTLENARLKRDEYLDLIAKGIDPINRIQEIKEEIKLDTQGMFLTVVNKWLVRKTKISRKNIYKQS